MFSRERRNKTFQLAEEFSPIIPQDFPIELIPSKINRRKMRNKINKFNKMS